MDTSIILNESEVPEELLDFKILHYKEIFKEQWEKVFRAGSLLDEGEEMLILKDLDKVVGSCVIREGVYDLRLKYFSILPKNRGKGYAKKLMQKLEDIAKTHHHNLISSGRKPSDIDLMYLKSLVYLDSNNLEETEIPALQFAHFLRKSGFSPYVYNKHELSKEEKVAVEVYQQLYPRLADRLRVFKKPVIDNGVELKPEIKQELSALNKGQWDIVIGGLNWKLGNYGKTGKVSYRYDLCPICDDMESSEMNSENCRKCYIHVTCMEPFRETGRFKEDFEVSNAYFNAMRDFMLANPPKD